MCASFFENFASEWISISAIGLPIINWWAIPNSDVAITSGEIPRVLSNTSNFPLWLFVSAISKFLKILFLPLIRFHTHFRSITVNFNNSSGAIIALHLMNIIRYVDKFCFEWVPQKLRYSSRFLLELTSTRFRNIVRGQTIK